MSTQQHTTSETNGQFVPDTNAGGCEGVVSIPGICGGEVCIVRTRIPVWILYRLRQLGETDKELLEDYPGLTQVDLDHAWNYVVANQSEIDQAVRRNGN